MNCRSLFRRDAPLRPLAITPRKIEPTLAQRVGEDDRGRSPASPSSKNLAEHFAVDVGQPALDAVVVEGETLVVDAEKMQRRETKGSGKAPG